MAKKFIEELLQKMTLEEKLGQMTQLSPEFLGIDPTMDLTGPMNTFKVKPEWLKTIGSTLNGYGAKQLKRIQEKNMKESRLGIPILFMGDVVFGYKTGFPIPLAMGCSFNPSNYEKASEIAAKESAASGLHLTFAPMTDLVRDPRWGRVMESTGEDTWLNCEMTKAAVRGFQGRNPRQKGRIASCVKHFAAYGAPWGGRDYNTVDISEGMLREYYLPAYKAAVDAGVAMVMSSFNTVERIPASANKHLLRDILRKKWGFLGPVISDYASVNETISHGIAKDGSEAALQCIEAGVDIEMMSTNYLSNVQQLIDSGKLDMTLIDEAVMRILELKDALGLFENPYKDANEEDERRLHKCQEHIRAAHDIAVECPVLIKNNSVLPISPDIKKIGLTGPFAGVWEMGSDDFCPGESMYMGLRSRFPQAQIVTAMTGKLKALQNGCVDVADEIEDAVNKLKDCDMIIACVGERCEDFGEAASKTNLRLSVHQERLLYALKDTGKPVVMVIHSGRPMEIYPVLDCADAILLGWHLGCESGNALADLLSGRANPSGRLAMSIPYNVGQIPVHYNAFNTGRPADGKNERYISRYIDCPNDALYCFGYGLSYSDFEYHGFHVECADESIGDPKNKILARAYVNVTNVSDVPGKETVQLYIRDVNARVIRPVRELRGICQIYLGAGQSECVCFDITKDMLSYWDNDYTFIFEPGDFDIMIGKNSRQTQGTRLYIES